MIKPPFLPTAPNGAIPAPALGQPHLQLGRRQWPVAIAALLLLAIAAATVLLTRTQATTAYQTVQTARGDLTQSVTASGTVNPQDTISVGTQVSGTIQSLYVDYNSRVRRGQILAQIDPSQFRAQLNQALASLAQARAQAAAGVQSAAGARYSAAASEQGAASAREDLIRTQAAFALAQRTLERDRSLLGKGYVAQSQYDADYAAAVAAGSAYRSARAAVNQTEQQALQALAGASGSENNAQAAAASVGAAQAIVQQDALNLERTTIVSPVDGTVVARNVSVGQTVAASFQTPTLFTIARDLRKMEVDIAVGEPDIGNVRRGASVNFTVLAYPNRTFHGIVSQVRVNPTTIANVVTYTVVILVGNNDNALLPGMTANASISVASVRNALLVPIQALQYRPQNAKRAARHQGAGTSPWGQTGADVSGAIVGGSSRSIFVLRGGEPVRIPVFVQLVSGTMAAITPRAPPESGRRRYHRRLYIGGPYARRRDEPRIRRRKNGPLMNAIVDVRNLTKYYAAGSARTIALDGVTLTIEKGEFVAVTGPSGSGKSTFMHIVGLLDEPTSGTYLFEGRDVSALSDDERADIRSKRLGFVFQSYNLLARTSALENVELPMLYAGVKEPQRRNIAFDQLRTVGIADVAAHFSNQMSGGQQQRVAIARSLVNDLALILADEPTGALDTKSSSDIMRLFTRLNAERGMTILVVTHEPEVASYAKRIIAFRDGRVVSDGKQIVGVT